MVITLSFPLSQVSRPHWQFLKLVDYCIEAYDGQDIIASGQ